MNEPECSAGLLSGSNAVIFDYDDTIVAARNHRRASLLSVITSLGDAPIVTAFDSGYGRSLRELVHALNPGGDFDSFFRAYVRYVEAKPAALLPGAREVIQGISRRGVPVAIVSSSDSRLIRAELRAHGMDEWFTWIAGTDSQDPSKPDPQVLSLVARKICVDCSPDRIVYVGDSLLDHDMAHQAGCRFIAVCTGNVSADDFVASGAKPASIVQDLRALLDPVHGMS
jgi:HAD superfamily hydrolase (TIGR01549 family)